MLQHDGAAIAYQATVHPHKIKGFVFTTIVAFDRSLIDLKMVAGIQEPESKTVPADRRSGLVPKADHNRLLVVFNGGFKAKHGRYGMMLDGDLYVPPKDDACAVAFYSDGSLRIRPWSELVADTGAMSGWRQTPPCLLDGGVVSERLAHFLVQDLPF